MKLADAQKIRSRSRAFLFAAAAFAGVVLGQQPRPAVAQATDVEVIAFQGGYGIDFFQKDAAEFSKLHPDIHVNVIGNPRAWDVLVPRFASGSPPDLAWPGWGMNLLPIMMEGQILPWDKYLDEPADGVAGKTWRETFEPDILKMGQFNGHTYVMPFNIDAYGWWYDKALFDRHGWTAPKTYEEFLVLGEKMKAENIAPLTFQGRYPIYFFDGIFYPWVISEGGIDCYKAAINLEPGAWLHPAFVTTARRIIELKHKHYFQGGCIGMNHTESQMELLVGRAAMIPCGSWIISEMKNLMPPGSRLTYMKTPHFANGKGDPTAVYVSTDGKGWVLPTKGNHHDAAAAFYKFVSSPEKAAQFTEAKGTLTCIIPEREIKMPAHLAGPHSAIKNARITWSNNIGDWYTPLETEIETAFFDLYNEVITPEEFCQRIETKSQAYRKTLGSSRLKWD